ncbi:MAG: AAA family ATPase [Thermoplasmatota archaeon]
MEVEGDEACALRVARALSYIDFSRLERWYDHFGFIKIFQGLRGAGSNLGWTLMIGGMERALAGDGRATGEIFSGILRENRVTLPHILELYPDHPPIKIYTRGFRVHGLGPLSDEALSSMALSLDRFGRGELGLETLGEELYRYHTTDERGTLYYHALLAARSTHHPVAAHLLWKALRLLPDGSPCGAVLGPAIERLERCQSEHLGAALRMDPRSGSARLDSFYPCPAAPAPGGIPAPPPAPPGGSYEERARRFLEERGISERSSRHSRFPELLGLSEGGLEQLLEPFLLRCYGREGEEPGEGELILAVGPPEVDKPALLEGIARGLGLPFLSVPSRELWSRWAGETESNIIDFMKRASEMGAGRGSPVMVAFTSPADEAGRLGLEGEEGGGLSDRAPSGEPRLPSEAPALQERRGAAGAAGTGWGGPASSGATEGDFLTVLAGLFTGPRKREIPGSRGSHLIPVATASSLSALDPLLRSRVTVVRLSPPAEPVVERILIQSVVGRRMVCDLDGISFSGLAAEARGLMPSELSRVARRAKLLALQRKARELGTSLARAPAGLRERIRESYMILESDLREAIRAERAALERGRGASPRASSSGFRTWRSGQTRLLRWGSGEG